MSTMQRTYVYKLKPTAVQQSGLERYLRVTRVVYNAALEQRITCWREHGISRGWVARSREIREVREAGLLDGCHVHAVQLALKRLDLAYSAFFARHAGGRSGGFPRFKSGRYWRSFGFKEHGNGWRIDPERRRLQIAGVGTVRIRLHRPFAGEPRTLSVVRKPDGWFAHIVCDIPALAGVEGRPSARGALDLGVEAIYTLHTGQRQTESRALARAHRKVKAEQKALSRKQRGSRRRAKQRDRLARAQLKLARVRRDHLHKLTHDLAQQYHTIAVEDLTITAMVRSARGTIDQPGSRVRQKAGLNRSIHDQAWGEFLSLLGYKLAGGLVKVDPRGTSQECSGCGVKVPKLLSERWHQCPECGLSCHRDQNAAINIYQRAWAAPVAEAA